jgi:hypothetical protein
VTGPAHEQRTRSGRVTYKRLHLDARLHKVPDSSELEGNVATPKTRYSGYATLLARGLLLTNALLPIALLSLKVLGEVELGDDKSLVILDGLRIRIGYTEGALAPLFLYADGVVE